MTIEFQIIDVLSTINKNDTRDLDKLEGEDEESDPNVNLYCYKNQRTLSYKNDTIIKLFGRTSDDRSILVNVEGFQTFFYLGFWTNITQQQAEFVVNSLKKKVNKRFTDHLTRWELQSKQPYEKFVGNDEFSFIKLFFRNHYALKEFEQVAMRTTKTGLAYGSAEVDYYVGESNLDEILKFLHTTNLLPASWVQVTQCKTRSKTSYCSLEVDCNINDLRKINKVTNAPFKIMIYDLECQSMLGELGEFPVAQKNYQKLARELIDLKLTHKSHPLILDNLKFSKVLETCLILAFTPSFYPSQIQQVKTVDNLKPSWTLIKKVSNLVVTLREACDKRSSDNTCVECIQLLTNILDQTFPPLEGEGYANFSREVWLTLDNLIRAKYKDIDQRLEVIVKVAFEDFYDRFGITPIYLKGQAVPTRAQLITMTPEISSIILNAGYNYEKRLETLTDYLNKQLTPIYPKGDPIIQIGFTLQRLGQKDPYLKAIFTVDSCTDITNDELIFDENSAHFSEEELKDLLKDANKERTKKASDCVPLLTSKELIQYYIQRQKVTDKSNVLVRSFRDESSMIKAFAEFVNQEDPDMVGGYNTFGFDDKYLAHRATELAIRDQILSKLTRLKNDLSLILAPAGADRKKEGDGDGEKKKVDKRKMETHYLEMKGRVPFDIYRIIPANHNLPEYKLNYVCRHFFKKEKNDVPPTQIPVLQRGNADDRARIARYCIIDCILCNRLLEKLVIIPNLIAMANVSIVPIRYLLFRGQTVKGYSLVVKKCSERGKVVRTLRKEERKPNADKYEGAIVLEPLIDIYDQPISVADFSSLYPSSMISENISNDTLVVDAKYDNLPGFEYNTIQYDEFYYEQAKHKKTGALLKKQVKLKRDQMRTCRFVGNRIGVLAEIESELIANRNYAKARMEEYEGVDKNLEEAWNCQQLAYKITCNSIYGITGAGVSPIYNKDVAASITATGRKMIIFSKNYVEGTYRDLPIVLKRADMKTSSKNILVKQATCVYGDSVANYTPILVKIDGQIKYLEIGNLVNDDKFIRCDDGKEFYEINTNPIQIWSDNGWINVKNIVRHKTTKRMYRVITHNAIVDTTEDHSLLNDKLEPIKPEMCNNQTLLTRDHPIDEIVVPLENSITKEMAWVIGLFVAEGTCGYYDCPSGKKAPWGLVNQNMEYLTKSQAILSVHYPGYEFKILDCYASSKVFKLVPSNPIWGSIVKFSKEWREMCYSGKSKIVPECIFNSTDDIKIEFLKGYYCGDGDKSSNYNTVTTEFDNLSKRNDIKTQLSAQSFYYLFKSLKYNVSLNARADKPDIYRLTFSHKTQRKPGNVVKKIINLGTTNDYVYDLETENHHFSAGIGNLVVHNTDSIFIKFDMYDQENGKKLEGFDALFASMEICDRAAKEISLQLKAPQNLLFEKTISPFLMVNKKCYVGNYYTGMNDLNYKEKMMGFATKKRDSAPIAKKVVDGLVKLLFSAKKEQATISSIREYLSGQFRGILSGELPLELFIRTKSWKGYYQNPDAIAQHILALRQAMRDPGNQFQVNDRIPFVHIVNPKGLLQGDRIESVDFVKKHNLKIDYEYYIVKQLIKPLLKILAPNKNLGITEKWLMDILKTLSQGQQHAITMDKFFKITTKDKTTTSKPEVISDSDDSESSEG